MKLNRRESLKAAALVGLGAALNMNLKNSGLAAAQNSQPQGSTSDWTKLGGKIYGVGFTPKRNSANASDSSSMITEITVSDFSIRQAFINIPKAHSVVAMAGNRLLVLPLDGVKAVVLNQDLQTLANFEAPAGFLFSGHAVMSTDHKQAYLTLRQAKATSFEHTGRIGIFDSVRMGIVRIFDSHAVRPHDILWLTKDTLAVSHYGDINYEAGGVTSQNLRKPCLVALNAASGEKISVIDTPTTGSLTHIAASKSGLVCAVPLNYFAMDSAGKTSVRDSLQQDFEITIAEELEGRLGSPMAAYVIDPVSKKIVSVEGDLKKQRRAQSVSYNEHADSFFITYTFSDCLAKINAQTHKIEYLDAFDLGLSYIRGIVPIGGTPYLAVNGEFTGIAIIDSRTLEVKKRLNVSLYDCPHLTFKAMV